MTMLEGFLQELAVEAATTRRVLERVPEGKLEWRPHPRARTLGELAAHVATLPGGIAEMATRVTFDVSEIPPLRSVSAADLPQVMDDSIAAARVALSSLEDRGLAEQWQMIAGGAVVASMPRAALLRSIMLNHWYHHRGQLTVYLRELDVAIPSIYGPSADENPPTPV